MIPSTNDLLNSGQSLLTQWCLANGVTAPEVKAWYTDPEFDFCAYYRTNLICIWPKECAVIGRSPRQWSYPGYVVDRTPYGVLQHELGHHVDEAFTYRGGKFSTVWRQKTGEEKLTNYCPNDMEWFAEIFRLFVTNPDLLRLLRPKTYRLMIEQWPTLVVTKPWTEVLIHAHERWWRAAYNKIQGATKPVQGGLYG